MPVERIPISCSQLAEVLGYEPARLIDVEKVNSTTFRIVLEPENSMQTSGTFPALNTGKKTKGKGGRKGC